jgi:hypothetical protein
MNYPIQATVTINTSFNVHLSTEEKKEKETRNNNNNKSDSIEHQLWLIHCLPLAVTCSPTENRGREKNTTQQQ